MNDTIKVNPLGSTKISKLMLKFAIPSIIAMMVSAIYNIVDQLFIGHAVGYLGNAATNIAFPLAMMCTSVGLLFGIGGASSFNISMGAEEKEDAPYYIGNSIVMLLGGGTLLFLLVEIFLTPLLIAFGSPENVLPYAKDYVSITAIGFPFLIITTGGGHLIRADGSPKMTMICNLSGAIINVFLDALFVLGFGWGMSGAAWATVIGQVFSGILALSYLSNCKTVSIKKEHLLPNLHYLKRIMSLGAASGINQIAMMAVQIVLNNSLKYYGARSEFGEAIPIASAGIVTKVNQMFFSVIIGIAQGSQPIESFNYGAKKYDRVRMAYFLAISAGAVLSILSFLTFQLFPRHIISLFGEGNESYYKFGTSYFRIFLFFTIVNFMQPITSTFFTSIGKAYKGIFLSLTRQILFLLPVMIILPLFIGIDGILYSGLIADFLAFIVTVIMITIELRNMSKLEQ